MKLSFCKAAHFLLVVMTTHFVTVVAPDPSQYMKTSDLNKKIGELKGSKMRFDQWDFGKRFGEGYGAGIAKSKLLGDSAGTPWNGERIQYKKDQRVTVLFADKGGNTDNGFLDARIRLIKDGEQCIVHLGREAYDAEKLEAYIVEIDGYIEEIANAKNGVDFPFTTRYHLLESLRNHIAMPDRRNAQQDKIKTVDTETKGLMAALKQIYGEFKGTLIPDDFSIKQEEFEKLLKKKIEASVDREITGNIIEAKFLADLDHYEKLGLMVIRQGCDPKAIGKEKTPISGLVDNPIVTANDPDVAPILEFTGGIFFDDDKAGAGRKGTTIMLKAVRELEIMHFLVKHQINTNKEIFVTAMDIESYISNTVDPRPLPNLEQWQKRLLIPQMRLPVTPNLTIVINQFTEEHVEVENHEFIQVILEPVWNTIAEYNTGNPDNLKLTSVKNYTAYRIGINPDDMPTFDKYETDHPKFLELIQGKVNPCPFFVIKGVCVNGDLTWDEKPLVL